MIFRNGLITALFLFSGFQTAAAQTPLVAVGVLERNGVSDCSAVLIAADLLVTAGHCASGKVVRAEGGEDSILFRTGAYPGRPATAWDVAGVHVHPMFHGAKRGESEALRHDAALLRLSDAVPGELTEGIPIDPEVPAVGERLLLATWPGGAGQRARERTCPVVEVSGGIIRLECQVQAGESGGAVLRLGDDGPGLVGVVVAKAKVDGRPGTFAVMAKSQITQIRAIYLN